VWVVWLSWRVTDPESATDRVRILAGAVGLLGLPWVARRYGLFGPVGGGIAARLVRVAGCAAICCLGADLLRVDHHSGIISVLGSGKINWVQEAIGLTVLIAGVAAPLILKARRPQTEREVLWGIVAGAAATALVIVPIQTLVLGYVAMVFAATSRRSPVSTATLIVGVIAGLPTAGVLCALLFVPGNLLGLLAIATMAALLIAGFAGAAAARLVTGIEDPDELRAARVRQGALAGATAGAVGTLVPTAIFLVFGVMMPVGPLVGIVGGVLGAAIAADRQLKSRRRPVPAGLIVPNP
jgi:hypothetical protein